MYHFESLHYIYSHDRMHGGSGGGGGKCKMSVKWNFSFVVYLCHPKIH